MGFEDNDKGMYHGILFRDVARICEYHHIAKTRDFKRFCEAIRENRRFG